MEIPLGRGPSISMMFALFCFVLPFITLSCPGGSLSFTGVQLATGTTIKEPQVFGETREREMPAEPLATGALGLTVLAALASFVSGRGARIATGSIGLVNFILLLLLKSKIERDALSEGGGMFQLSWGPGFWLALFGYASTAAIVVLILRGTGVREPEPVTSISSTTE